MVHWVCGLACGCGPSLAPPASTERSETDAPRPVSPASAPPAAIAAPIVTPPPAEASDEVRWRERWKDCLDGQALTEAQNRELDYFHDSPFSVIRVSPSDTLNVRRESSPNAESLAKLGFREAGLRWTGGACNVAGTLWFEIEAKGLRGWVNGFYARPTSKPRDETARVKAWASGSKTLDLAQFTDRLRLAVARQEASTPLCDAKLIGSALEGVRARIVLYVTCGGDDSIAGSELLVTASSGKDGWAITSVDWRDVCWRGADELCI